MTQFPHMQRKPKMEKPASNNPFPGRVGEDRGGFPCSGVGAGTLPLSGRNFSNFRDANIFVSCLYRDGLDRVVVGSVKNFGNLR
jgi:hypothetical protein